MKTSSSSSSSKLLNFINGSKLFPDKYLPIEGLSAFYEPEVSLFYAKLDISFI